jgi:hypothetical protein
MEDPVQELTLRHPTKIINGEDVTVARISGDDNMKGLKEHSSIIVYKWSKRRSLSSTPTGMRCAVYRR